MTDRSENQSPFLTIRRAVFYFGLVYFSQGICSLTTLLNQPLRMYLQRIGGLDAPRISAFLFIANIPWMIKPLYGMLTDFVPIFGYRRRSYLLILNLLAAMALLFMAGIHSIDSLLVMVFLIGIGVGASDVVVDALMVQTGQETGQTRLFQSAQWFSKSLAAIVASLMGAALCSRWSDRPESALRAAALIAMGVPFVVALLTWSFVHDRRASINLPEFTATGKALFRAFVNARLWLVAIFLLFTNFNPGMKTAMYAHLENHVGLSHAYLAWLDTMGSVGSVTGTLIFMFGMSRHIPTRIAVSIGLLVGAAGLLPMLLIHGKTSAQIAYFIFGATGMIAALAHLTVAADACPRRVEAIVFAALMSLLNFSTESSDVVGSRLYDGIFHQNISPLILISASLTAASLVFVPFLRAIPMHTAAPPASEQIPAAMV